MGLLLSSLLGCGAGCSEGGDQADVGSLATAMPLDTSGPGGGYLLTKLRSGRFCNKAFFITTN